MTAIGHTENPGRKTFAFYWSFKDAIRDMPDADKLAVYEAITDLHFRRRSGRIVPRGSLGVETDTPAT